MDITLTRTDYRADGIFSELRDASISLLFYTLEHASKNEDGDYYPKIPEGTYTCVRGKHRLEGMEEDFETFEITNVPGHTGILFHVGNWNCDSSGCALVGESIRKIGPWMLENSRSAFNEFMRLQKGVDSFKLKVINCVLV